MPSLHVHSLPWRGNRNLFSRILQFLASHIMLLENLVLPCTSINDSIQKLLVHLNLLLHGCLHKVATPNLRFAHDQLYFLLFSRSILDLQKLSDLLLEAMTCFTIAVNQCDHLIDTLLVRG